MGSEAQHESDEEAALRSRLVPALAEYLHTDVYCSYRRLVPADLAGMYSRPPEQAATDQLPACLRYDW